VTPADIRFSPEAVGEAEAAYRWYRERSPAMASAFLAALERAVLQIAEAPERPAAYLHGTRRVLLRRFPYMVVYRVHGDAVEVVAVAHGRRRPGYWRTR
jgi:plasmid stabilization system protein ParE